MSERNLGRVGFDGSNLGNQEDEVGEPNPEQGEYIGEFSVAQKQVLDAGREFLANPDFLNNLEANLEGLAKARDAEIFVKTAAFFLQMKELGYDFETCEFPMLDDQNDQSGDSESKDIIQEYLNHPNEMVREIFANVMRIVLIMFKMVEVVDKQLTNEEGSKIFEAVYESFRRRVKYFKDCLNAVRGEDRSVGHLIKKQKTLRKWQEKVLSESITKKEPKSLAPYSDGVKKQLLKETCNVELNTGCSVDCYFCAANAGNKVGDQSSFEEACYLAVNVENPDAFFYRATDPGDYVARDDGSKSYADVLSVREAVLGHGSYVATAYPAGSKERILKIGDRVNRVSVSEANNARLGKDGLFCMFGKTGYPLDLDLQDGLLFGGTRAANLSYYHTFEAFEAPTLESLVSTVVDYKKIGIAVKNKKTSNFAISGRKRSLDQKKHDSEVPEFSGSIFCTDGIVISPNEIRNTAVMFSTDKYEVGAALCKLELSSLNNGEAAMSKIIEEWNGGKTIIIDDLLPHGIVQYKYGSLAVNDNAVMRKVKDMKREELLHDIVIKTFNEDGGVLGTYKIEYHLIDGKVLGISKV